MISRTKKRWSGRLRTAGALLLLLGTVGFADALVARAHTSAAIAALLLGAGLWAFVTGRTWSHLH